MLGLMLGLIVGLWPALSSADAAGGQQTPGVHLVLHDGTGDLRDPASRAFVDGPSYADVTTVDITTKEGSLVIRFDVAGPLPATIDRKTVIYGLLVDVDEDGMSDHQVVIVNRDGWHGTSSDLWAGATAPVDVEVGVNSLTTTIPLTALGSPSAMRFRAGAETYDFPERSDTSMKGWFDLVPDRRNEWGTLETAIASARPTLAPKPVVSGATPSPSPDEALREP